MSSRDSRSFDAIVVVRIVRRDVQLHVNNKSANIPPLQPTTNLWRLQVHTPTQHSVNQSVINQRRVRRERDDNERQRVQNDSACLCVCVCARILVQ